MNQTKLLVGSLSNDLLRVAKLTHRGSHQAASRFMTEAQHWGRQLADHQLQPYIKKIVSNVVSSQKTASQVDTERYLMYSVLLQNYARRMR